MKTNKQVAEAFVNREWAKSGSLESDAVILYSYETPIAYWQDGVVHISTQYHSPTTTRHHSALIMALMEAGYDGCAPWPKTVKEKNAPTVPFHGEHFPATRYGKPRFYRSAYGHPSNRSDPDSPAVVWQRHEAEAAD